MYRIDENTLRKISAKQFCNQFFKDNLKPVIFWDTCALLDVINKLDNTAMDYTTVRAQQMPQKLHSIVDAILHRTFFITIDKTATSNAHKRVLQKKAPAGKKEEFKDCTIWEVMLSCYRQLNTVDGTIPKVFYTVNTQDFCKIENKVPQSFIHELLMEAIPLHFICCKSVFEVVSGLGL